jgi:hypothetical protein
MIMNIKTKSTYDQSDIDCHNEIQVKAFADAVRLAGGVLSLSAAMGVTPQEIQRWKRRGGVPIYHALQIEYAFNVKYVDLIRYDEALPLSEAIIRQSLRQIASSVDQQLLKLPAIKENALQMAERFFDAKTLAPGDDQ